MKSKFITLLTAIIMCVTLFMPQSIVFAEDDDELDKECVMGSSLQEEMGGGDIELMALTSVGKFSKSTYGATAKGIDVSRWQGDIDWAKVKKAGIEYAIIRAGCTKSDGTIYKDPQMEAYVKGCEANGIKYGFYYYSVATTTAKVDKEISALKSYIKGKHPSYPVYYDLEDKKVRAKGKTFISNMAVKFCTSIDAAGYKAGIYASKSWWEGSSAYLNTTKLDKYEKWIAQWPSNMTSSSRCTYSKPYGMWQFTSSGSVSGISGAVDLDFAYKSYSKDTPGYWDIDEDGNSVFMEMTENTTTNEEGEEVFIYTMAQSKWIVSGGKSYYLDESGHKMTSGIHEIDSKLYFFASTGYIYKSKWITYDGKKYYALSSGKLCRNGTAKIDNFYYGFNNDGVMLTGNQAIGTKGYYFFKSGISCLKVCKMTKTVKSRKGPGTKYKRSTKYKKGKQVYVIRTYGKWSQLSSYKWVLTKNLKVQKKYPTTVVVPEPTEPTAETTSEITSETSGADSGESAAQ